MEAKVAALENEIANLRTTLTTMQERAESHQAQLLEMLASNLSKQTPEKTPEKGDTGSILQDVSATKSGKEDGGPSSVSGWTKLKGGLLDEFRKSAKKVELPLFNGEPEQRFTSTLWVPVLRLR